MLEKVPDDFENVGDVMTNFDHTVEDWAEEKLKSGKFCGDYPGWNFHARVWFDENFKAEVKQYGSHVETVTADTLKEIMEIVSDSYGCD